MSKNHASSGSASTVSSAHSAVTRETTPRPSRSSRSFSASAVTMFVISLIIFCTNQLFDDVDRRAASWASWTREDSPSFV
jgi:hypothetical protein